MIRILIVDDDPAFGNMLAEKLRRLPLYRPKAMVIQCLNEPAQIEEPACYTGCDLLFLDIELGKENGMALARRLRQAGMDGVLIFVTRFKEYAPEGYEVGAFRYLAKKEVDEKLPGYFAAALEACRQQRRKVDILCEGEIVPVPVGALIYIESNGHIQTLHLERTGRDTLQTRVTLSKLEELLLPCGFLRIHKGYLVNMAHLHSLKSTGAKLCSGLVLPVGSSNYRRNKERYLLWRAQQS